MTIQETENFMREKPEKPVVFFDVETTGLDPTVDVLSCAGFLTPTSTDIYFNDDASEMLNDITNTVLFWEAQGATFVSYNGTKFDIPFLEAQFKKQNAEEPPDFGKLDHLDLMPVAIDKINGGTGRISKDGACRKMGIYIPSCIDSYCCALVAQNKALLPAEAVLDIYLHNMIDLYATARLYAVFKKLRWI